MVAIGYVVFSNPAVFGKGGDDPYIPPDSDTHAGSNRIHSIRSNRGSISSNPNTRPTDEYTRPADGYACPTDEYARPANKYTRPADEYSRAADEYSYTLFAGASYTHKRSRQHIQAQSELLRSDSLE